MNRRSFIKGMAGAIMGFSILPAAMTYRRQWKRTSALWIPNPAWESAEYEMIMGQPIYQTFERFGVEWITDEITWKKINHLA